MADLFDDTAQEAIARWLPRQEARDNSEMLLAERDISRSGEPERDSLTGLQKHEPIALGANRLPRLGRNRRGVLSERDDLNPRRIKRFKDDYRLTSRRDRRVRIDMRSGQLNPYLQVIDPKTGQVLHRNNNGGARRNARLVLDLSAGDNYIIRATSARRWETGRYRLRTRSKPLPSPPPAPPAPPAFDARRGYGLIDAAAAVAAAMGRSSLGAIASSGYSWNNDAVNAPEVWASGITGRGVTVAVVDSGLDVTHTDLDQNIWRNRREIADNGLDDDNNGYIDDVTGWDFIDGDNDPQDETGHGTHVAGIIAAERNRFGITGVAHGATLMPVRVLGEDGFGTVSGVAAGIRYAADNGADVINLSLGTDIYSQQLDGAVRYATQRGAIVVSSAGNSSLDQPGYPAQSATQSGFSVGAIDRDRQLAGFSNRAGSNRDLHHVVAPGVAILSTLPDDAHGLSSGTSMAAPHMAGVAALMLSANPTLTHEKVREIVINTTA